MSIADDLATMARVGGNIIYYTGQGIGQGIGMAIDAYNWINDNEEEDEDIQPPINEEIFQTTQGLMRRGEVGVEASRPKKEQVEATMLLGY